MFSFSFKSILFTLYFIVTGFALFAQQENINKGWDAFNQNKRAEALRYFSQATADPATRAMARLSMCLVYYNDHKPTEALEQFRQFYQTADNPYPYIYALWTSSFLMGDSRSDNHRDLIRFFGNLAADPKANATIHGMAASAIGNYYQAANEYVKAREAYRQLRVLDHWSVTGIMDNISGSGFNKYSAPLEHPEADAIFKNHVGADIRWFEVKNFRNDRWFDFTYHFPTDNAIAYAQTFVHSGAEKDAILMTGVSGSLKIWVNDQLVNSIEEERNTDMDVYNCTIHLHQGYNRILLQVGSSEISRSNFMVRLTDTAGNYLTDISSSATYQPYKDENHFVSRRLPLFAEKYFLDQQKKDPGNPLYAYMLAETYLRNEKTFEARKVLAGIRSGSISNSYASLLLIRAYSIDKNNTDLTKEEARLKKTDPDHYQSLMLCWQEAVEKEDYSEAERLYTKLTGIYGEDEAAALLRLSVEGNKKDMDTFIKDLDSSHKKYPNNYYLTKAKYTLEINTSKNLKAANAILEQYLLTNSDADFQQTLINNYFRLGDQKKAEEYIKQSIENKPYATGFYNDYAKTYFNMQNYGAALKWEQKTLEQAPYVGAYYNSIGHIYEAMNKKEQAIAAYSQCIYFDPTDYEARRKLRELQHKTDLFDHIPQLNTDSVYSHAQDAGAYPNDNSIILLDDQQRVVYHQGASEERTTILVKIFTQAGIDTWKECSINYNPYTQRIIIEKAEVLKKDGSKIKAEINDNDLVFTSLEAGDGITYTYRIENYNSGRLSHHFWDNFHFNYFIPVQTARYTLVLPASKKISYRAINTPVQPAIQTTGDYKMYSWQVNDNPAIQSEPYMPVLTDIGQRLEISSIPDWKFIADWYSDISSTKAKGDFEIKETVADLFKDKASYSELEKAKMIYNYIVRNINYSDVSFLHSAFTPQRASRTLNTRLGDCKDLATLYVAMAKEVGLKANLILVDTRDNGDRHLLLPSVNFNHCIASVDADGKSYLVELTYPYLPFGTLTGILRNTSGLYIPRDNQPVPEQPVKLNSENDVPEAITRNTDITLDNNDFHISRRTVRTGSEAAGIRSSYARMGKEDQMKNMSASIGGDFKTNVSLDKLNFMNLDNLADSVQYNMDFSVKDAASEVADMTIIKLPWTDAFNSLDFLSQDSRIFPFELWQMGLAKKVEETIILHIPKGKKLAAIPKDVAYSCGALSYRLRFRTTGKELIATREIEVRKDVVAAADYKNFKDFFSKVSSADGRQYGLR